MFTESRVGGRTDFEVNRNIVGPVEWMRKQSGLAESRRVGLVEPMVGLLFVDILVSGN